MPEANPNKGYNKDALKTVVRTAMQYYVAQYGTRQWIIDSVREIVAELEMQAKWERNKPPGPGPGQNGYKELAK